MMRPARIYPVVAIILLLFGLGTGFSKTVSRWDLDDAERLAAENPKKAFERLSSYDITSVADSAIAARYSLLLAETAIASGNDTISVPSLAEAEKYYSTRPVCTSEHERTLRALNYLQSRPRATVKEKRTSSNRDADSKTVTILLIACGVFLLISIALAYFLIILNKRLRRNNETELFVNRLLLAAEQLKQLPKNPPLERTQIYALLTTRLKPIAEIARDYYSENPEGIAARVREDFDKLRNDEELIDDIAFIVDNNNQIFTLLCADAPELSESNKRLFLYLAAQLPPLLIALLLDISPNDLYRHIDRLRNIIASSSFPHKYFLLTPFPASLTRK